MDILVPVRGVTIQIVLYLSYFRLLFLKFIVHFGLLKQFIMLLSPYFLIIADE